jgi:RNA polymerase sigma-70 factor, ECF subfamily
MQAAPAIQSQFTPRPTLTLIEGGAPFRSELSAALPGLRARALKLTRHGISADDLVQDTVERALRYESSFSKGTNLRAWLHSIMFSVFATRCRRMKRERYHLGLMAHDQCAWTVPEGKLESQYFSPALKAAIDNLNPSFREVLLRIDLEDEPYREAATALGIPLGTVMSRLHRARRTLRAQFTESPIE